MNMPRLAWLTDIHLEFLEPDARLAFVDYLAESMPDIVLVGGDPGIALNFASFLQILERRLACPIYFVLGNHDFYRGSIAEVRAAAERLSKSSSWLPMQGIVEITKTTGLIGHDSWADGRLGNGSASQVELNDYFLIKELTGLSRQRRFMELAKLGDEAAEYFRKLLPQACARFKNIILLTHVPPFREACWHEGKISDDEYLPHFACKAVGEVLASVMAKHPKCKLTVLCGHTHSSGVANILPNLCIKTGSAEYGHPSLQELIIIE
jgi:3',5'-cyclic AMP phosphodiesterase CpdA